MELVPALAACPEFRPRVISEGCIAGTVDEDFAGDPPVRLCRQLVGIDAADRGILPHLTALHCGI